MTWKETPTIRTSEWLEEREVISLPHREIPKLWTAADLDEVLNFKFKTLRDALQYATSLVADCDIRRESNKTMKYQTWWESKDDFFLSLDIKPYNSAKKPWTYTTIKHAFDYLHGYTIMDFSKAIQGASKRGDKASLEFLDAMKDSFISKWLIKVKKHWQ